MGIIFWPDHLQPDDCGPPDAQMLKISDSESEFWDGENW